MSDPCRRALKSQPIVIIFVAKCIAMEAPRKSDIKSDTVFV